MMNLEPGESGFLFCTGGFEQSLCIPSTIYGWSRQPLLKAIPLDPPSLVSLSPFGGVGNSVNP